jgi:hypothetical protein
LVARSQQGIEDGFMMQTGARRSRVPREERLEQGEQPVRKFVIGKIGISLASSGSQLITENAVLHQADCVVDEFIDRVPDKTA